MIIDTSVLVTMIRQESDAQRFFEVLRQASALRLSAASYVELAVVIDALKDPIASGTLDELLKTYHVRIEPLTETQARIARTAYQQFGKGSGHPARLNMGDCFAYALARDLGEPLLFKGDDFTLTDIEIVIEPIKHKRLSEVVASYGAAPADSMADQIHAIAADMRARLPDDFFDIEHGDLLYDEDGLPK